MQEKSSEKAAVAMFVAISIKRERLGISMRRLSEITGVSVRTINKLKDGLMTEKQKMPLLAWVKRAT